MLHRDSSLSISPSTFSRNGFHHLSPQLTPPKTAAQPSSMGFDPEGNIPLTKIQSVTTGARKPGEGPLNDYSQQDFFKNDEKHGWSGRRKAQKTNTDSVRIGTDGETVQINRLGRFYKKVVCFSSVTRYLVYIVPVASLIAMPLVFYAVYRPNALFVNTGVRVHLFWTWIEIVWLSLWGSKLFSKSAPHVFVTLCGVVSAGTRKYAAILHAVQLQLNLVIWATISLVTFTGLMSPGLSHQARQKHWIPVVKNFLGASLVASLLYMAEKTFVQLISINYHRRSFENRIKENKHFIRLLSLLYEASRTLFPLYCQEFIEEDTILIASLKNKLNKAKENRSGSATPLRIVGEIGRFGDKVSSAFGNIASEITGKHAFSTQSANNVVSEALKKASSSEALAKRLWMSFVIENHDALYASDIRDVLGTARHEEANECFNVLDADANGNISLDEMIMKVVEVGRDRKAVTASMRDVGQAIGVLDRVLVSILFVIVIFTYVGFQHTSFFTTLATAGTTLLSLSFVFAVTTQEFLGSCIFLFVKHPYDVGDRCDISNTSLVVEQISLLFTVFKRIDNMRMVQIPNTVLNSLWIENTTRSKAMKEQLEIIISFDTPLEDIETLRTLMENFVRHPDNSRDFQSEVIIETTSINSMDKLSLKVEIRHKSNWHNEVVRAARRNKFMCALIVALRKVPIYSPGGNKDALGGPKNPTYTVAVTDDWAETARQQSSKDKISGRLVPLPTNEEETTTFVTPLDTTINETQNLEDQIRKMSNAEANPTEKLESDEDLNDQLHLGTGPRSNDIDSLRQGLLKRQSTRGRRRLGEVMQPIPQKVYTQVTSLSINSPISNSQTITGNVNDEENQIGMYQRTRTDTRHSQAQQYPSYPNQTQWPANR